jgi:3-oxoacyl-[acyl-carrier protein] reductase
MADLSGKLAVVTGASRGIGQHIARALHDAGATVAITGRHEDTIGASAAEIGDRCHPFVCDQRHPEAVQAMAQAVVEQLGWPDILVNNAAAFRGGPVAQLSLEAWNEVIETNLTGVFVTTQAFLSGMIRRDRGDIYMIGSMSGVKGDPGSSPYAASKFGLRGFSQALLYEVRQYNVRVTILNLSAVDKGTPGAPHGKGLHLHAADVAATIVHLAGLPGRTMLREVEVWGTNP